MLNNTKCDRCGKRGDDIVLTMSYFNTEMICMDCDKEERKHKDFNKAKRTETEQVKNGNYNYGGVGKPEDL